MNIINLNHCPSLKTDYCFGLGENCSQYYMVVNGKPSICMFDNFNICVHSEGHCFTNYSKLNMVLSLVGSSCYIILIMLHYCLREKVKKDYNIEGEYDICAVTLCSSCGLAQQYRELEVVCDV